MANQSCCNRITTITRSICHLVRPKLSVWYSYGSYWWCDPWGVRRHVWLRGQSLQWRHNGRDGVSIHQPHDCLLNRLFRPTLKKTSNPRVTGLCEGNSPVTGEFPTQMASNAEIVSIWWRHHVLIKGVERLYQFTWKWYVNKVYRPRI